jgi:hypothetical protein
MSHPIKNFTRHGIPARGWNTWNTRSVLSHVLMPEALALNLSFCHYGMLKLVTDAFFEVREQGASAGVRLVESEVSLPPRRVGVQPGRHAYDAGYTAVTVILGEVSILVETAAIGAGVGETGGAGGREIVILATPLSQAAHRPVSMIVEAGLLWNRPGHVGQTSSPREWRAVCGGGAGAGAGAGDAGAVRIHCTNTPVRDPNAGCRSPYWVFELTGPAGISAGGAPRPLDEITALIAGARAREDASHQSYGEFAGLHAAYQACLAWNTFFDPAFDRVLTTSSRPWNVLRLGYGLFCWDTFTFAWMQLADCPALARNSMLEVFREMVDGKFVPNVVNGSGRRSWDRSQPPLAGITMLAIHESAPDLPFLENIWPALLAWNRWWHEARRNPRGLLSWGSNPVEPKTGDLAEFIQPATPFGASLESGQDNSPMYDGVPFDEDSHLMMLSDVGLASLYITDCQSLAILARRLGRDSDAAELDERGGHYAKKLAALWNPGTGIFQNRRTDTGEFSPRLSPTLFYPLLAGAATGAQADSMVDNYLLNPGKFWGEWVLPAVPRDDPAYPEQHYWRGRIWAVLNFLVYLGLKRAGRDDAAARLARRSRELFERNWEARHGVFENYSAVTGKAAEEKFCDPMCAWSGLLAFMEFMENGRIPLPSLLRPPATPQKTIAPKN